MRGTLLALVCLLGSLAFFGPKGVIAHENLRISMGDGVYEPQDLEVHVGEEVEFRNTGKEDKWPASNIHPTHGIYPEFDPKRKLAAGESWKFKVERPGEWRYHDHLSPDITGTITVLGEEEKVEREKKGVSFWEELMYRLRRWVYERFPKQKEQDLARVKVRAIAKEPSELKKWLRLVGGESLMEKLIKESGGGSTVDCHQEAHNIGRAAYEVFGEKVFRWEIYECHSGYLHGAMEEFLTQEGTAKIGEKISKLCGGFSTEFGKFECLHGVGHGVLAFDDYDLPKALETCGTLNTDFEKKSCYGGAFMENIVVAEGLGAVPAHKTTWVSQDPHFPCNAVAGDFDIQTQCYLMQTSRMLDISKRDFDFVNRECGRAPEEMTLTCYQSMGRDAAGQTLRDPKKIVTICDKAVGRAKSKCLEGALYVIIEFWGENMTSQPVGLCKEIKDSEEKSRCYNTIGIRLRDVFGESSGKKTEICGYGEEEYILGCKRAAGV